MRKKVIIFIFILVLIFVTFVFFFLRSDKKESSPLAPSYQLENKTGGIEPNNQSANIQATSKNYRESSEKYKYQIDVSYPFFDSLEDKKAMDAINMQLEKEIQKEIDKYIAEARKNKIAPAFGYLTGNYEYSATDDNTLSVKVSMEKYLSGAANPNNFFLTFNYDLGSGKQTFFENSG